MEKIELEIRTEFIKLDSLLKFANLVETGGIAKEIILDRDKRYKIVFLDKTRNDDGNVCVLFEFEGNWNKWKEIGYCNPIQQRT